MKTQIRIIGTALTALLACVLCLAFVGSSSPNYHADPTMLATYTWNDNVSSGDWDNGNNWTGGGGGYPDDSTDDAIFDGLGGADVDLNASRTIDDLTISGLGYVGLNFDGEETARTLTCDTLTISNTGTGAKVSRGGAVETQ